MKDKTFLDSIYDAIVEVATTIIMVGVLSLCIGLLIAPAFECFATSKLRLIAAGGGPLGSVEEIVNARYQIKVVRALLWVVALGAWTTLFVLNLLYWV